MIRILSASVAFVALMSGAAVAEPVFNRISAFAVPANMPSGTDAKTESSAEIIAATEDGMMLAYSDSPMGGIGFVDITDVAAPKAGGFVKLEGEPTSLIIQNGKVIVGLNTSKSRAAPSGALVTVNIATKAVEQSCDLGGQPDSVALAPDVSFVAIAIENERDEDVNDGKLPQMPAGYVVTFSAKDGVVDCATRKDIAMTGLAAVGGDDPEPEFLD
ncbi:MAG: esterase-like activity of phytase family protein, partial [Notoacmeibacter sp.]